MASRWASAFSLAAMAALVAAAWLRVGARTTSRRRLRQLGGVALLPAVIAAPLAAADFPQHLVVIAIGATALLAYGALDEYRSFPTIARLAVVSAAAVALVLADVQAAPTGSEALDIITTILWVVVITLAVRGLDATDGVAPAVAMTTGVGVFGLAGFGDQLVLATMAAALVGACLGFLAYNARPASVFLGWSGALFLGYLLSAFTIEVRPAIDAPGSLLVPVLLVGIPLLDLAIVSISRTRRALPLTERGRDRLIHRLVARGLSRSLAVMLLVIAQLALAFDAVFVGRGVLSAPWGGAAGAALLAVLAVVTIGAPVYAERPVGLSRRARLLVLVVLVGAGIVLTPTAVAAADAQRLMNDGREAIEAALVAARAGDDALAEVQFAEAQEAFGRAHDRLDAPYALPGLAVPVLGANLTAARELSAAGADLAEAGVRLTAEVDPDKLEVVDGTVPLAEVQRLTPDLEAGAELLREVARDIEGLDDPFLLGPVRDAVEEVEEELVAAEREADNVAAAAKLAPAILGGDGPRRYFLAVQNSAEQRGTGGFIGSWGILTAEGGKVDLAFIDRTRVLNQSGSATKDLTGIAPEEYLTRYGQFEPATTWQNVNMSPDFPTVGQVIAGLYPQSGGEAIDGVLAVDPQGLAALLELTGPVTVQGWPEPLTADNVVDVTLRDAYAALEGEAREDFLGEVAETAVDTATEGTLGRPARLARVLGKAAHEGHLLLAFVRPEEQALAEQLRTAGEVPPLRSDALMLTTQNAGGNKLDYYLKRSVDYEVSLRPDENGRVADASGHIQVTLDNTAPASGLPQYVSGPFDERFVAGENRTFLSLYTPLHFASATLDGFPAVLDEGDEQGRDVYSGFLSVFAGASVVLDVDLAGTVELGADGWYRLDLVRQPGLYPDEVTVSVTVPEGWRIAETEGLRRDGRTARGRLVVAETTQVRLRVERTGADLWERLNAG